MISYIIGVAAVVLLAWDIHGIAQPGAVFSIVFFHLPAAVTAMSAAGVAVAASLLFLRTRDFKYDDLAVAATEVGLAFLAVHLATGAIWGRTVWGTWWSWDAGLTTALVCWLLYAAYLMLRHVVDEPTRRATFAAVVSILAFVDVPIVYVAIRWWRAPHPHPALWNFASMPSGWTAIMLGNVAAMTLLGALLTGLRLRQEEARREIDYVRRTARAM